MTATRRLLALCILLFSLPSGAVGIAGAQDLPRDIRLDHELSLADSLRSQVDFKLSLPYERLVFEREDQGFEAQVRIVLRARRNEDGLEESLLFRDKVRSEHFAASRAERQTFETEFGLPLPPGQWQLSVQIFARGPRRPWVRELDLDIPDTREGGFFLHGPRWTSAPRHDGLTPPFRFRDPWRIPEERSLFMDGLRARVGFETSLLGRGDTGSGLDYILTLENRNGDLVHYDRRNYAAGDGQELQRWEIPLERLGMGSYLLTVTAVQGGDSQHARGRIDLGLTAASFDREWGRTRELLRPIALPEEWQDLEGLPRELRLQRWRMFWDRRGPTGDLPMEPGLDEYCRRIDEANRRFGVTRLPGYLGDRGQVFLEHGKPDRSERFEDDGGFRTLEYWYYGGLGLVYIFEDRHGSGDFVLSKVSNS